MSLCLFPIVHYVSQLIKSTIVSSQPKKKKKKLTKISQFENMIWNFHQLKHNESYQREREQWPDEIRGTKQTC